LETFPPRLLGVHVFNLGFSSFNLLVDKRATVHNGNVSHVHPAGRFNTQQMDKHCNRSRVHGWALLFHGDFCIRLVGILKQHNHKMPKPFFNMLLT
jgi:hypothetical protein